MKCLMAVTWLIRCLASALPAAAGISLCPGCSRCCCSAEVYVQSNVTTFYPRRATLNGVNCSINLPNNLTGEFQQLQTARVRVQMP